MDDKWRILVVDDDLNTLNLVQECLNEKYDVLPLHNPSRAQAVIDQFQPDLAILDIMMPRVNGYQVAQYIKNHREHKHIPVIFLSAKHTQSDMKIGYQKGADFYLTKPFQPERLQRNVDLIFERTPPSKARKRLTFKEVKLRLEYFSDDESRSRLDNPLQTERPEETPMEKKRPRFR